MLNCLKFDLYKVLKSKSIWWITIISLIVELAVFISQFAIFNSQSGVLEYFVGKTNNLDVLVILFTTLFVCKDFSNGYVKNFYTEIGKLKYVLSKCIVVVLYVFLYQLIFFLLTIVFVYLFGVGAFWGFLPGQTTQTPWDYCRKGLLTTLSLVNVGIVTMFFGFLFKKEYIAFLIILPWFLYLQSKCIGIIESVIYSFKPIEEMWTIRIMDFRVLARNDYATLIPRIMATISAITSFLWSYLLYKKKKI